ncbi:hypothetical protein D3C84_1250720 [compost metagenome]
MFDHRPGNAHGQEAADRFAGAYGVVYMHGSSPILRGSVEFGVASDANAIVLVSQNQVAAGAA